MGLRSRATLGLMVLASFVGAADLAEAQNDLAAIRQLMLRSMALMAGAGAVLMTILILFGRTLLVLICGQKPRKPTVS